MDVAAMAPKAAACCFPSSSIHVLTKWQYPFAISQIHKTSMLLNRFRRANLIARPRLSPLPLHVVYTRAGLADRELKIDDNVTKEEQIRQLMQDLADSFILPPDYLGQLPSDLKNDLKDAAFALANGPVKRECGEQVGESLLQISQALVMVDTEAAALAVKGIKDAILKDAGSRSALGKRLIGAGRRFAATGQYGQGELQKIAKALITAGDAVSAGNVYDSQQEPLVEQPRVYKFGALQVELTSHRAYIGCAVALIFGALSWQLTSAFQSISDNSLQYANDNALLLATSLRGTLLVLGYSCTSLSALAMVGLFFLGTQLSSQGK